MSHSTESSNTSEGETGETSHVEVVAKRGLEVLLQWTVDFVTAQRSSNKSLFAVVIVLKKGGDPVDKVFIRKSGREGGLDLRNRSLKGRKRNKKELAHDRPRIEPSVDHWCGLR